MKKAIVTGVSGQDGYYMCEYLLNKGYQVIGVAHSNNNKAFFELNYINEVCDLGDYEGLVGIINKYRPNEIYNFAAKSTSFDSWKDTVYTFQINLMAPAAIMEILRDADWECKFFQALSCEIFGANPAEVPQNELTMINPGTPYSSAKAATLHLIRNYRSQYNVFIVGGIFYNHESVRRNPRFISAKITETVAKIKLGLQDCLYVGNIDSERDFGYAPDYIEAAWKTMQMKVGDDYIIATGKLHSVREMIELSFATVEETIKWVGERENEVGINDKGETVVRIDKSLYRTYERQNSVGNISKICNSVKWNPSTSFEEMIRKMVGYYLAKYNEE